MYVYMVQLRQSYFSSVAKPLFSQFSMNMQRNPLFLLLLGRLRLRGRKLERLRGEVHTITNLFPNRGANSEVSPCLGELQWLVNNSLLLLVITDLGVTGGWEILSQWMSLKTIVSHNSTQVWVALKENTKHIICLSFVPVCTLVYWDHGWHRRSFGSIGLHSDSRVVTDTQQVVHNIETVGSAWVVSCSNIHTTLKLSRCVVFQVKHHWSDGGGSHVYRQLVLPNRKLLDVFGQTRHDVTAKLVQLFRNLGIFFGWVDEWNLLWTKFLSWKVVQVRKLFIAQKSRGRECSLWQTRQTRAHDSDRSGGSGSSGKHVVEV